MSRPLQNPLPGEVVANQRAASDPAASVWVEANAGSGKTHVLTQRVLRLLLAGVPPDQILCLTYTKAAAAEMRRRVGGHLASWALLPPEKLAAALLDITGYNASSAEQNRARTLFAHALDTPGGLRIQTIHAFCESVLHRFPVEAGVPIDFVVLEDHQRAALVQRAREVVLAGGLSGSGEAGAVETLFGAMSDFVIAEAIDDALARARPLRQILADRPGAKARLRRIAGAGGETAAGLRAEIETGSLLTPAYCAEIVTLLGGDPAKSAGRFANVLAALPRDRLTCDDLLMAFMTDEGRGSPRTSLMTAAEKQRHPLHFARLEQEQRRVADLAEKLRGAQLIERSEALLDILAAIITHYERDKRARSFLDFDDLIETVGALFRDQSLGLWVRYRLDAGISHILVDESQDTNREQWEVVKLLAAEFFTGMSAADRPRTVFAVGDGKQSIYSFQGAAPELFQATGDAFAEAAAHVEMKFERRELTTSFRTLPNILDAVDRVFAGREAAVLARRAVQHKTARADRGGSVTLWEPIQVAKPAGSEAWPEQPVESLASAPRQVAQRIAREIRGWVDSERPLAQRGRAVRPDDVLILVQARGPLFHEIIRALNGEGLPTPGADRLLVTTHIAILDLLALGDVLLNSSDDLQLAALLRSPLFAVSEDELFALSHGRKGTLWSVLRDRRHPAYAELSAWRHGLDTERPYDVFAHILYAAGGLRRFHDRFGPEVDDLFTEFLELAFEHEDAANPSLQGFLAEMRSREVTITRELAGAGGVRIMTVHGAKGLESPIVILADAATKPQPRQLARAVLIDTDERVLVHSNKKTDVPGTTLLRDKAEAASLREFWRKLYVAMTRAEDELYVTGALTPGIKPETQLSGSWYEAIKSSLIAGSSTVRNEAGEETTIVFPALQPAPAPVPAAVDAAGSLSGPLALPPLPARKARPVVRPSMAFEKTDADRTLATAAEAVVDAESARREGIALHALLQHLVRLERDQWETIATKALAALLPDSPARHAPLAAKAIAILTNPAHAEIFGPNSRAEVPFLIHAQRNGEPVTLAGRIDRLVVTPGSVLIVDFKSDANPPPDAASTPSSYVTQLGLYALVANQLFPGSVVQAAILWTSLESLLFLERKALAEAVSAFTMR
jgi:ATP-dependent helicase/nuclease subunit A